MKDYLVYHNPDQRGVDVTEVEPFAIVTDKPAPRGVIGSRVWLLTGRGRPRTFLLRSYFIVDQVETGGVRFQTRLSGEKGKVFQPMLELNHEEWFDALKRNQRNFASGLQSIKDERFVRGLEELAGAR